MIGVDVDVEETVTGVIDGVGVISAVAESRGSSETRQEFDQRKKTTPDAIKAFPQIAVWGSTFVKKVVI